MDDTTSTQPTSSTPEARAAGAASGPAARASSILTVLPRATARIKEMLAQHGQPAGTAIRIGVKGGGCSGFSYTFEFEPRPPTRMDYVIETDGVRVVVDKRSSLYLAGTELDYEATILKQAFVFRNPKATATCSCGTSFTVR